MPRLVSDVVKQARFALNDFRTPYRFSDAELVAHANGAVSEAKRIRPDLFDGRQDEDLPLLTATSPLPVPDTLYMLLAYYVAGTAELADDEHVNSERAAGLLAKFQTGMTTRNG